MRLDLLLALGLVSGLRPGKGLSAGGGEVHRHTVPLCCGLDDAQRITDEKDPMIHLDSVYQELLGKQPPGEVQPSTSAACSLPAAALQGPDTEESSPPNQEEQPGQKGSPSPPPAKPHQSPPGPVTIKEPVEFIPEEEICKNRLSEEELRNIPRFSSYHPGEPNKVCGDEPGFIHLPSQECRQRLFAPAWLLLGGACSCMRGEGDSAGTWAKLAPTFEVYRLEWVKYTC